jgi:hypothetical protein
MTVGGVRKASPKIGYKDLRSLIEFERFGLSRQWRRDIIEGGNGLHDQIDQPESRMVRILEHCNE